MPGFSPNKSPIIEAFMRGLKQEKSTTLNSSGICTKCYETVISPRKYHENHSTSKKLVRKLLLPKSPLGAVSLNGSTDQKSDMLAGLADSDASTHTDSRSQLQKTNMKDGCMGFGNSDNLSPWQQRLKSSTKYVKVADGTQSSLGTSTAKELGRVLTNQTIKKSEQQPLSPEASSLGVSNIFSQEKESHVQNRPCVQHVPVSTSYCNQSLTPAISRLEESLPMSEPSCKSNLHLATSPCADLFLDKSSQKGLFLYGERKSLSVPGLQCIDHLKEQLCNYRQSGSAEEMKNTNNWSSEKMQPSSNVGVPHIQKVDTLQTNESLLSDVSFERNSQNPSSPSVMRLSAVSGIHGFSNNIECSKEKPSPDEQPVKKCRLSSSSPERIPSNHSCLESKDDSNESPEDLQLWPRPLVTKRFISCEQSATNQCKSASCHVEVSPLECQRICYEGDSMDVMPSMGMLGKFPRSMGFHRDGHSQSSEDRFSSSASMFTKRKIFTSSLYENVMNDVKLQDSLDSDDGFECNLESDDEDDMLKPLEEIMHIAAQPLTATPQKASLEVISSQESITASCTLFPAVSPVAYSNSLDRMLKEKEDSKRLDDLERKLKGDIEQGMGIFCTLGEEESNNDEEGTLSEEHRAFITKFSVVTDAIPDLHPGEEIFHLSVSGKLFNQHTLDLKNSGFVPQREEEKLMLSSGKKQQLILITQGFLSLIYRFVQCPVPILKWLFQMMSVHSDYIVSVQILNTLMDITVSNFSISDAQFKPWIPSVLDVAVVFFNMGVDFASLFSLDSLQPDFKEDDILIEIGTSERKGENHQVNTTQAFWKVPENNIFNVVKFLGLCTAICPEGYKDQEIMQLLTLLFKIRLEKQLKQIPLVDFHCLLENLLKNIRDWDAKVVEICSCISELSSHHHNLLKLVQLVPNSITRGRQLRRHLSLMIISKLMGKKLKCLPEDNNLQMSVLHQYLIQMKPSTLTKKMLAEKTEEPNEDYPHHILQAKFEQKAYYLTYSLLNLVNEASYSDACPSSERTYILKLCSALEKHVKCDIREDARLFYRTKVKDLVARIYGKWQELLHNSRPNKGKLHDYWEPVSESQSPTSKYVGQIANETRNFPIKAEMEEIIQDTKSF
ncbi:SMC5-SMC6 complex localization factor protein 2 isoform X2 [Ambystoma mexicanum]